PIQRKWVSDNGLDFTDSRKRKSNVAVESNGSGAELRQSFSSFNSKQQNDLSTNDEDAMKRPTKLLLDDENDEDEKGNDDVRFYLFINTKYLNNNINNNTKK